jgi:SapC
VRAGKEDDGRDQIAPIAVLGLMANQNLYENDGQWRASYMPAVVRCYPFCIGRIDADRFAICVDTAWPGVQTETGTPLFTAEGEPSPLLSDMRQHLENLETEVQRTRLIGQRLQEYDLLRDMRFDATLADGRQHSLDGFLTVDEEKMQALPDAVVGQLHREGVLGLIHAHWLSMGHMRRLVDWHAERNAKPTLPTAANA